MIVFQCTVVTVMADTRLSGTVVTVMADTRLSESSLSELAFFHMLFVYTEKLIQHICQFLGFGLQLIPLN